MTNTSWRKPFRDSSCAEAGGYLGHALIREMVQQVDVALRFCLKGEILEVRLRSLTNRAPVWQDLWAGASIQRLV